jgi:superfamily II DNA or RNA helicase
MNNNSQQNLQQFRSLFKGREDVFAVRWEKENKSGYMPAYSYDPYHYRMHKMNGGTFQNYNSKSYLKLSDYELEKHFNGFQQIGIYPLLQDNTSWFIVADFDKENWQKESVDFLNFCKEKNIPAYLERSRSGNGGHIWIFFEKPYPAIRSRKIFISFLQESGVFSVFDKNSSFDRLFPNQDFLSGKGLGNLIALPLFKTALDKGNSCFIHSETFEPFLDQWEFLKKIERVSTDKLDSFFQQISKESVLAIPSSNPTLISDKLEITLSNKIRINKNKINSNLTTFLKEELNFANSEFIIKKKSGKSTFGTERYFKLIEETENEVFIPRGCIGKLMRFCKDSTIDFEFKDERVLKQNISFVFNAQLRKHQLEAISTISKKDMGVIVSPTGSGKTVLGLKIISDKKQPALIVVHRKQLLEQWMERVEAFLGIPRRDIGIIGQGKTKIGIAITLATIQSLPKHIDLIKNSFGLIIVDECHHIPAETFRSTIEELQTYYLYGLTATPFRKYNDGKLIFTHLGEIIINIQPEKIENYKQAKIIIQNTSLDIPYHSKTDQFETLSKILVHDSARNKQIMNDIKNELQQGKKIVIITERKEHIDVLYLFLKQNFEVITLSGDDSETNRKSKWKLLQEGNFQALITTGQYFGEGSDLDTINSLFLVYPFSFKGKLIQYIGRVQRSEITPIIYDYRDIKIDYLNKLFLKRNVYYRKINKQATLFDEPEEVLVEKNPIRKIEKTVKVPIMDLEFYYGNAAFNYMDNELGITFELEIENSEIRPEFEVLKPYFIKALKSKTISVELFAEFENDSIVSQLATSKEIEYINKEIVENVKFQFLSRDVIGKIPKFKQNLLTSDEIQDHQSVFSNSEEILSQILQNKNYRHSEYVKFLAERHESGMMKLRFVLNPFSFLFLLQGRNQYHFILETLDTEEATYIWHTNTKTKKDLMKIASLIDGQLNAIKESGRQTFLDSYPENFTRILHNYADEDRGFTAWWESIQNLLNI